MTERKRAVFADRLEWRVCRHRRIRRRPLPRQDMATLEEEYCDLSVREEGAINQWCRRENCPYLDCADVP